MKTETTTGGLCDVTFHEGVIYTARMAHSSCIVNRFEFGQFLPGWEFHCEGNGFPRLKSVNGNLWLMFRAQSGQEVYFHNLTTGFWNVYTAIEGFYQWPMALGNNGYAINFTPRSGTHQLIIYDYDGEVINILPAIVPSSGIAWLGDDNIPVSMDESYGAELEKWDISYPQYADRLFCGQGHSSGGVGCVWDNRIKKIFEEFTETFVPKIAKKPGVDEYAIVAARHGYQTMSLWYDISSHDFEEAPPIEKIIYIDGPLVAGDKIVIR